MVSFHLVADITRQQAEAFTAGRPAISEGFSATETALCAVLSFLAGVGVFAAFYRRRYAELRSRVTAEVQAATENSRDQARNECARLLVDAKDQAFSIRKAAEAEAQELRQTEQSRDQKRIRREELLGQQEESLRKQHRVLEASQTRLAAQMRTVSDQRAELERLINEQQQELQRVSGLNRELAAAEVMDSVSKNLQGEIGTALLKHQRILSDAVDDQARTMLLTSMQRYAAAHTADTTTSTVDVPTDDMKGRIIGRDGRNIRAFEKATGVDVIIDDTPGVVIISGFDPVRREIARQALDQLIADGRIHPSKIEEVVGQSRTQIDAFVMQKGQEAAEEVNVPGLPEPVVKMLGGLYFRTSYSQNVLRHSIEVAFLTGMLAEMLGLDGNLARRCGLLHDIGKAADHELEGGHPKIGADLLRRNHEAPEVVHAALGHHDEIVTEHPYTMLVATADACSASRPGARRESLSRYIKRMEELEAIAKRFDGVEQAFAIAAGRELRVIVGSQDASDQQAAVICRDIAVAFENELTYPGEIKITVVRESRFTSTAK